MQDLLYSPLGRTIWDSQLELQVVAALLIQAKMIDISTARLQPFQAFHSFHERINIHIKVASSASLLLVRHTADPSLNDQLADLIVACHPSWNAPPVRELSIDVQRAQESAISAFVMLAAFSAFDDFLVGIEAEISRFNGKGKASDAIRKEVEELTDDEEKVDRVFRMYAKLKWSTKEILLLQPILRYFRLCRNCIAHRDARVSKALATQSSDPDLAVALAELQEKPDRGLKVFKVNEKIYIPPTLAIMSSHVLRLIAMDANQKLVSTLGLNGVLKSVAYHAVQFNEELGGKPRKRPEAIFNSFLIRSKIRMESRDDSIKEMKQLNIWTPYFKAITSGRAL